MKPFLAAVVVLGVLISGIALAGAQDVQQIEDVVVTEKKEAPVITLTPEKTTINIDSYETTGTPQNVSDFFKDQAIIDFRGATDLVPGDLVDGDDSIYMRGFGSNRFTSAIDGSNIHKHGGRSALHVVDYSLIPPFLIDEVEILTGPHSALYPGQSIAGVINMVTRAPEQYDSLKPELSFQTSFKSYNTQNHSIYIRGGVENFIYDAGYQRYSTDGYLRHAEADIDTAFCRLGYLLPSDAYVTFLVSQTSADREIPIKNDPTNSDYDNDYPDVSISSYYGWQTPEWNEDAISYRLNYHQPSPVGVWDFNAYYSEETWEKYLLRNNSGELYNAGFECSWHQQGAMLKDTITFSENHVTTIGADLQQFYDGWTSAARPNLAFDDEKRVETAAGFAQHEWKMIPRLTLTAGLRYEHVDVRIDNQSISTGQLLITGQPRWIERSWAQWIPKSFLTYELDDLASSLRDTSISMGISKIWRAPTNYGEFNPRCIPAGAWVEPEHGIGYDFVVSRRLFKDIHLKFNYAYYEIKDYLAWNWDYAENTPSRTNTVTPGMEYSDYVINLEKVIRHGIELQLNGHLTDKLSFYLGYAYQTFENKGGEPAGETAIDNLAKNRVNGGLRYQLFRNTHVLLDYKFQDDQVVQNAEEVSAGEWVFNEVAMDAYHVFDLAVQQNLFEKWGLLKNAVLKVYVNNLLDEDYENLSGYPATDRTFGFSLGFDI